MTFHFRTTILDLARMAANLACFGGAPPPPAASRVPAVVDLAPHEWRCIAERTIPPHEMAAGARVFR
jgi:hypothetical protein